MGAGKKAIDAQHLIKNDNKPQKYDGSEEKPQEAEKEEENAAIGKVSFWKLFRYADAYDYILLFIGTLCSITHGAAWPYMIVVLGDTIQAFIDQAQYENFLDKIPEVLAALNMTKRYAYLNVDKFAPHCPEVSAYLNGSISCDDFDLEESVFDKMKDHALRYSYLGIAVMMSAYGHLFFFVWTSERQILRMRLKFYRNVLKQEMAWFDTHTPGELTVKITDDISMIHDAFGDKTGTAIQWLASFLTGVIVCFSNGWKLTFCMLSSGPVLFLSFSVVASLFSTMTSKERVAYAEAGAVAEEVLSSIRTVAAFGGQEKETKRYMESLEVAKRYGIKKSRISGIGQGISWFIIYCGFSLGFYYGGKLVRDGEYSEKDMMIVFFTSIIACVSLAMATPALSTIKIGCGSAFGIFAIMDRQSRIDSSSTDGLKPKSMSGQIRFKNVHFNYPSRPQVKVLDNFNLTVSPGQTVALVGSSGCGKSTTLQLLLRFYDPDEGEVTVDDVDVQKLNLKWLRQRIGLVGQEPVLFSATIAENIRLGKEDATMEEIIQATKNANAYDFIRKMPDGFDTNVGERGAQLSGGQKQRIAIARALISNPTILFLDEATSALDTESEAVVQDALDKASEGRSTIVIAHRLSTVRNADVIVTLDKGKVVEKGTHDELMAKNGVYHQLVSAQLKKRHDSVSGTDDVEANEKARHFLRRRTFSRDGNKSLDRTESFEKETDESLEGTKYVNKGTLYRLFKMNKPEWGYLASGAAGSLTNGCIQPVWGLVLAYVLEAFSKDGKDDQKDLMNELSLYAVGLAVLSLFAYFFQEYSFGVSGESLTMKMRIMSFKAMIRQEIAWFDDVDHQTGMLGSQLATEGSLVQGAVKTVLGCSILSLGNLGAGIIIGFVYSWRLSLLALAFTPFVLMTGLLSVRYLGGAANEQKAAMEEASKSSMASFDNIRTVAALAKEESFHEEFSRNLSTPFGNNTKSSLISSITYAVTQSAYYFTFGACFYYGSRLLKEDKIESSDTFKVFNCIILGSVQLGQALSFAPNTSKALQAAGRIFHLNDTCPKIDPYSSSGIQPGKNSFKSSIRFSAAKFRYPTREDILVLNNFDVSVEPGQMLALVGESGCGKSTTVQLLQRFYDTESGAVFLDKYNIQDLNVQWLRSQIGMVSQEPILFDTSIGENIAYGDNTRKVSMDEIIAAARSANIHNFIATLPDGYQTNVGSKGTQLSGGQKQRIAIARALVRNPKILLLDEATSALDTESEKIVQEALDRARQGRTCITIAHRLSTIKNADKIAVLKGGQVVELGTHSYLMSLKSHYYQLQIVQTT